MGLIQPSRFQPTVFLLETFFFFHAPNVVLSAWQIWMHLMHFGVVNNNNSNKTEGSLRSFVLSAVFWWKPWWPDPSGHFQGSLPLLVGATGRHLAWDAGVSTRSIPKTRRGVEWGTLFLALALILNCTLKHAVKSFGTQVYNAAFRGLTAHEPHPPGWASHGQPTPSSDHGRIYTLGNPKLCTHLPVPPRDPQLSTCWGVLERQVGQVAAHHRAREKNGRKGQTRLKKTHWALEQEERQECCWLVWVLCWHLSGSRQVLSSSGLLQPP